MLNSAQLQLIRGLQDRMNIILQNYAKDQLYAPPAWTFENIWHALEALIGLSEDEARRVCTDIATSAVELDSSNLD